MKQIETLIEDIEGFLNGTSPIDYLKYESKLGEEIGELFKGRFIDPKKDRTGESSLYMSSVGVPCKRKLWYREYHSDQGIPLRPQEYLKFFFGDILEAVLLELARCAGHEVVGEQDQMELHGVRGRRDAVIDGVTIDCKSSSSFSFGKFRNGLTPKQDPFGYLTQLGSYVRSGKDDPLVTDKDRGGFFVIDKQHGHLWLDLHEFSEERLQAIDKEYHLTKGIVGDPDTQPDRHYSDVPDGQSGNRKLDVNCSYCEFKKLCWPGVRTFLYSNGPRHLTVVKKRPQIHVREV